MRSLRSLQLSGKGVAKGQAFNNPLPGRLQRSAAEWKEIRDPAQGPAAKRRKTLQRLHRAELIVRQPARLCLTPATSADVFPVRFSLAPCGPGEVAAILAPCLSPRRPAAVAGSR